MADTAFWCDPEARFRAFQAKDKYNDPLCACWHSTGWTAAGENWCLSGGTEYVRTQFTWLAERAAVELRHPAGHAGW